MTETIIIAIITAIVTITGSSFAFRQQRKKDAEVANLDNQRLKRDIEKDLWERTQKKLKEMAIRIDTLETGRDEDAKRIGALETERDEKDVIIDALTKRVTELENKLQSVETERDQWKARAQKAEGGNRRI